MKKNIDSFNLPKIGFGTFIGIELDRIEDATLRHKTTVQTIINAFEIGYRHLDLASNYNNLAAVREALAMAFKPKSNGGLGLGRDELWLTMKGIDCEIMSIQDLLLMTGVTYFDLFLIHSPQPVFESPEVLEHAWKNLCTLHAQSCLHHLGVSNFYQPHLKELLQLCDSNHLPKPYANQIQLNVLIDEDEMIDYCAQHNILVIAYSPLGYQWSSYLSEHSAIANIAREIHATPAQVALAWLLKQDITVIPKSMNQTRMLENLQAPELIEKLTPAHMQILHDLSHEWGNNIALNVTAVEAKQHGEDLSWSLSQLRFNPK